MVYVVIFFMSGLFSQNINFDNISSNQGSTGSIGTVTINDEVYNQISLRLYHLIFQKVCYVFVNMNDNP